MFYLLQTLGSWEFLLNQYMNSLFFTVCCERIHQTYGAEQMLKLIGASLCNKIEPANSNIASFGQQVLPCALLASVFNVSAYACLVSSVGSSNSYVCQHYISF